MQINNFYVYEYVRLDTFEPFYIGKGKGERWKDLCNRSKHFKDICKNRKVACIILHENLTEQQAFQYECWYIWQLRDIEGYNLINKTDGGEGVAGYHFSNEQKEIISQKSKAYWSQDTVRKKQSNKYKGSNNPCFGRVGNKHPLYGKKRPEHAKLMSKRMTGSSNPASIPITVVDKDDNIVLEFSSKQELYKQEWRKDFPSPNSRDALNKCIKEGIEFHGYKIKLRE